MSDKILMLLDKSVSGQSNYFNNIFCALFSFCLKLLVLFMELNDGFIRKNLQNTH